MALLLLVCDPVRAAPPGFRKSQLTDTPNDRESTPRINDYGAIVWSSSIDDVHERAEIYLYSNGQTSRLTDDDVGDVGPDINNKGEIVWEHKSGDDGGFGPTMEVVLWQNGLTTSITDNTRYRGPLRINDSRVIVWDEATDIGCDGAQVLGIRRYTDGTEENVYDDGYANQLPVIGGERIVWNLVNWCDNPVSSKILMYSQGNVTTLSDKPLPQIPSISPDGRIVAWTNDGGLEVWQDGHVTRPVENAYNPVVNSRGDIVFLRWNDESSTWESWLYLAGEIRPIAADANRSIATDMNERGDIVMHSRAPGKKYDIYLYHRLPDGDLNCDERVDFDDIDGFVSAITNRDQYENDHPDCDWWLADMNGNRSVDFDDIDGFIDCLTEGGCER